MTQWTIQHTGGPRYFEIRDTETVLVVEDSLYRQLAFRNWIGASVKIVSRADSAIQEIKLRRFDWIFLDRDFLDRFGEDVAAYLAEIKFVGRVVIHSGNPFGAQLIAKTLTDAGLTHGIVPLGMFGIFRSNKTNNQHGSNMKALMAIPAVFPKKPDSDKTSQALSDLRCKGPAEDRF